MDTFIINNNYNQQIIRTEFFSAIVGMLAEKSFGI